MKQFKGRQITKKQYECAMQNGGYITDEDMIDIFDEAERLGYGVYSPKVYEENGKYFCEFRLGDSCD